MKITTIKQQLKRTDRYSVYVDDKYIFSLSEAELLNSGLKKGQEFTEAELADLKQTAVIDKGYDRVLNLISHRVRSEWEIQDYLKRKQYDESTIQAIVAKLQTRGYIDDTAFAKRWVENRRLLKPVSRRRLIQELKQKRVDAAIIEQILAADKGDEITVLKDLIARKRRQTKYQDDLKLAQYLARQGFSYADIKAALADSTDVI